MGRTVFAAITLLALMAVIGLTGGTASATDPPLNPTSLEALPGTEVEFRVKLDADSCCGEKGYVEAQLKAYGDDVEYIDNYILRFFEDSWETSVKTVKVGLKRSSTDVVIAEKWKDFKNGGYHSSADYNIQNVRITASEFETPGITLLPGHWNGNLYQGPPLVHTEEGYVDESSPSRHSSSYDIWLDTKPEGDVTITPTSSNDTLVKTSGAVTFTEDDWSSVRTIRVQAHEDDVYHADRFSIETITHEVTGYGDVEVPDVKVRVYDNDDPPAVDASTLTNNPYRFSATPGSRHYITKTLNYEPNNCPGDPDNPLYYEVDPGLWLSMRRGGNVYVSPNQFHFDKDNWDTPVVVSVTVNRYYPTGETATVHTQGVPGKPHQSSYGEKCAGAKDDYIFSGFFVDVVNSATPGLTILPGRWAGRVNHDAIRDVKPREGELWEDNKRIGHEIKTYQIWLDTRPTETVTVTPVVPHDSHLVSVTGPVTWTPDQWKENRIIWVTSGDDDYRHPDGRTVVQIDHQVSGYGDVTTGPSVFAHVSDDDLHPEFWDAPDGAEPPADPQPQQSPGQAQPPQESPAPGSAEAQDDQDTANFVVYKPGSGDTAGLDRLAQGNQLITDAGLAYREVEHGETDDAAGPPEDTARLPRWYRVDGETHNDRTWGGLRWLEAALPPDQEPTFGDQTVSDKSYIQNSAVDETLPQATGGDGALTYSITETLPAGLEFTASTRRITGTPTTAQAAAYYTYSVSDADGDRAAILFAITIAEDLQPSFGDQTIAAKSYTQNSAVDDTLPAATGGDGTLTYSIVGTLPAGLQFNASTRRITGTPTTAEAATSYTYRVTDSDGDTTDLTFTIAIAEDLTPSFGGATISAKNYTQNAAVDDTLPQATGGDGALSYSIVGTLPAGLQFTPSTRKITGTPTGTQAAANYTYRVTDSDGDTADLSFTIAVSEEDGATGTSEPSVAFVVYEPASGDEAADGRLAEGNKLITDAGLTYRSVAHGETDEDAGPPEDTARLPRWYRIDGESHDDRTWGGLRWLKAALDE